MKSVLITGCSDGGIGQSLAEHFAKAGCHVYATARNVGKMTLLKDNHRITLLELDVCNKESILRCRDEIERSTGGSLDVLVNNAGIATSGAATDMNVDTCREVFEANVFAVMEMCKQFAPLLIKAKGTIVSIGSVAGIIANPFGTIYHSSKAALHMYMDCLRMEMDPFGVKVVTAVTGGVQSNIVANSATRFKLPETSIFRPIESDILARREISQGGGTCPRDVYADTVVSQVLRPSPPARIWKGKFTSMIWILNAFVPYWVTAAIMSRRFGMAKFKAMMQG